MEDVVFAGSCQDRDFKVSVSDDSPKTKAFT